MCLCVCVLEKSSHPSETFLHSSEDPHAHTTAFRSLDQPQFPERKANNEKKTKKKRQIVIRCLLGRRLPSELQLNLTGQIDRRVNTSSFSSFVLLKITTELGLLKETAMKSGNLLANMKPGPPLPPPPAPPPIKESPAIT